MIPKEKTQTKSPLKVFVKGAVVPAMILCLLLSLVYLMGVAPGSASMAYSSTAPVTTSVIADTNYAQPLNSSHTRISFAENNLMTQANFPQQESSRVSDLRMMTGLQQNEGYLRDNPQVAKIEREGAEPQYFASLKEAVAAAEDNDTIELLADDATSLTDGSELVIDNKSLTITGKLAENGEPLFTIYGKPNSTSAEYNDIFIKGSGNVTIQNVKIKQFGNQSSTNPGSAPLYVSTNFTGSVNLTKVYVSEFNRGGIFLYGGTFVVDNCYIDCANSTNGAFTKGIEIKGAATGTIKNTVICNMERPATASDATAGIELYGKGSVSVEDCTIISDVDSHKAKKETYGIVSSRVGEHDPSGGSLVVRNTSIDVTNGSVSVSDSDEYGPVNQYNIVVEGEETNFTNYISTWSVNSTITIDEGNFSEDVYAYAGTIIIHGGVFSNFAPDVDTGSILIDGGSFDKEVPVQYCAPNFIPGDQDPDTGLYTIKPGYKITYLKNNEAATGDMPIQTVAKSTSGETIARLNQNAFTLEGKLFGGWRDSAGTLYADEAEVLLSSDLVLNAEWVEAIPPTVVGASDLSLVYGYSSADVSVSATAAAGHSLAYQWYSNTTDTSEGGTLIENATNDSYAIASGKNAGTIEYYYCVVTATSAETGKSASTVSEVATVSVAKADPVVSAPSGTAIFGQTLANVVLANPEGNMPGTWVWVDPATSVGAAGSHTFKANFIPTDSTNYNTLSNVDVAVTVSKANSVAATVKANNRTFDTSSKALVNVNASTLVGGTMKYALGKNATTVPADSQFTTTIPTAINAGTYHIWYKVSGDANHNDTKPVHVQVTVSKASIANAVIKLNKTSFTYNGKVQQPTIKTIAGKTLVKDKDYTIKYSASSKNPGTYKVTAVGKGNYQGTSKVATYKITKAKNTLQVKPARVMTVSSKKDTTFAVKNAIKITGAKGSLSYKKASGNKYITVAKNGAVKVKKGLKKGTYKIKVSITAKGTSVYAAATKAAIITIKVK